MEANIAEALIAKANAEKQFMEKDFVSARNYALKAQMLCPELEGISQMITTFSVYIASEAKINGEFDFYAILGLDPSVERSKLKRQYKKMAVLLHPDKNKTIGADGAFRLISEAWSLLSDPGKRSSYDHRRSFLSVHTIGPPGPARLDTFWTVCTSCHVQYEYLRKYVNKRLSCKNCRGVFVAVETGLAPVNNSFPYSPGSYVPTENGYGQHGTYTPMARPGYSAPNGVSSHHGHRSEYVSNISFQSGNSVGVLDPNGLSGSSFVLYQENGRANKTKTSRKHHMTEASVPAPVVSNGRSRFREKPGPKRGRKRKVIWENVPVPASGPKQGPSPTAAELNGNGTPKLSVSAEPPVKRCLTVPSIDTRQLLINKARLLIRSKLEEIKREAEREAAEAEKKKAEKLSEAAKLLGPGTRPEMKRTVSGPITVPDSDFHDFDKDRSEECFKPKQIWALYDEEDGMPRLYCLIREVISVKPFKIFISYLSSKSDTEFGIVNWLDSGFTKSCGNFRVFNSETVEQVNIFSHLLSKEKAGRGGCVRIYPRCGDIWAVYRNWSPDWNRSTPDEVRHQYEMVEVLDDYSEEQAGVWVAPLVKVDGFKTVYKREMGNEVNRWVSRREMLRFSHQVPSALLKVEGSNLPEGCWDLDPAATPEQLLQQESEARTVPAGKSVEVLKEECRDESKGRVEEKLGQTKIFGQTEVFVSGPCPGHIASEVKIEEKKIPDELFRTQNLTETLLEVPLTETITEAVEQRGWAQFH